MSKQLILKPRQIYLDKLIGFQDTEPVKVVTGVRRCGKSSLLKLMIAHLQQTGIKDDQIVEMNFESFKYKNMTADELYAYVQKYAKSHKRLYLFFDEIQRIKDWEGAVNAFRVDLDCDIYITGSNAYLLSSEYSTYLSGRYVEIKMLPLLFREFLLFHDFIEKKEKNLLGNYQWKIYDKKGNSYDVKEIFSAYLHYGGLPGIAAVGLDQEKALAFLDGIYSTVVIRDILEREKRRGQRKITDGLLLRKIILFLADNIGSNISAASLGNVLCNTGAMTNRKDNPSTHTIQAYIQALLESYIFYESKRFDIKGKGLLRTLGKYYIVDMGLRNYLLGFQDRDRGHILENVVYLELRGRGYDVAVGKIANREVDFIATKGEEKVYFQVTETMAREEVRARELEALEKIDDNYEKIVLTMDRPLVTSYEGIKVKFLPDWLLE